MLPASDGTIYFGGAAYGEIGKIHKAGFFSDGYLESSVYDTEGSPEWGIMSWTGNPIDQIFMKVRTGNDSLISGATPWDSCPSITNGQDISSISSVNDGDRYIQYRVEMETPSIHTTPTLYEVTIEYVVGIEEKPEAAALLHNYPNPFGKLTIINYQLPTESEVSLRIYNVVGQLIRTLVDEKQLPGYYTIKWDGRNDAGQEVSPGLYFYQINADNFVAAKKLLLVR